MRHFSNTQVSMKLLDEIIIPYVEKKKNMFNLGEKLPVLLLIDVFSGQMTQPVIDKMAENYIKLVKVPANITQIFQPLDFRENGSAEEFMKSHFTKWYSRCIVQELDNRSLQLPHFL